jgi:hypothetical protein
MVSRRQASPARVWWGESSLDLTSWTKIRPAPNPFLPTGERPTGPAWYQTHTVAYTQELGYNVEPIEAYRRRKTGAYRFLVRLRRSRL